MLRIAWVLASVVLLASAAGAQLGSMDLLTAMELGLARAEFRGNGDSSVVGRIWSAPDGPTEVTLAPGTQFWAQLGGGLGLGQPGGGLGLGQPGGGLGQLGGGRQGMGLLGQTKIDLGGDRYAQAVLPTACTDIGLPAPTRRDVMVAVRCPDPRVARITSLYGQPDVHPAAVQVAVWAVANDPPARPIDQYLQKAVKLALKTDPASTLTAEGLLQQAAELLRRADVDPELFSVFR
jgi:hypothetical protein